MKVSSMKLISTIALLLCAMLGSVTAASAASVQSSTVVAARTQAAPTAAHSVTASDITTSAQKAAVPTRVTVSRGYKFNKMMAFLGCITGVGVPAAVGWLLMTTPAGTAFLARSGPLPAGAGAMASKYAWYIKGTCGYALF